MNRAILIGHLGKAPELRFTPQGRAVARFSLATSERWTDQQGQKQERTDWHHVVAWGPTAEACGRYLDKGRQVLVEGKIQTRSYETDGIKRSITEIIAQHVEFLGGTPAREAERAGQSDAPQSGDDIPF